MYSFIAAAYDAFLTSAKSLVRLGASTRTHDDCGMKLRESALHWIVAFDEDRIERAANALFQAGSQLHDDVDWYHPCIELHGIFPTGGALNYALKAYSFHAIRVLLKRAASIDALKDVFAFKGSSQCYPVEYAIAQQSLDILRELGQFGAFKDIDWLGNPVDLLANMPRYQADAIGGFLRVKSGQSTSAVIDFIAKIAPTLLDSIPEEAPPIISAASCHNKAVVSALLKHNCDANVAFPTETGSITPLGEWAKYRLFSDETVAADLVVAGANINQRSVGGNTPLHFAAGDNNAQVVKHLLDLRAQIDATSRSLTPLHTAAIYGAVDSGRVLLEHGANFCATTDWNRTSSDTFWSDLTPGALAANRCKRAFLDMLLEFDSTLIARPPSRDTLLHFAVSEPETRMLDFLFDFIRNAEPKLHAQAYFDTVNAEGWTAMHLCVGNIRRQEHCESLIRAGANINQLSSSRHSILDIAKQTRERVKNSEVWEPPQGMGLLIRLND
jgi:ankyrin repeat protein